MVHCSADENAAVFTGDFNNTKTQRGKENMSVNNYKETQVERGCVSSVAEVAIEKSLSSLRVIYKREVEFSLLKTHYFDFYIPSLNIIIEFDGKQHRTPDNIYDKGDGNKFQLRLDRDRIKNKFCNQQGMLMVRLQWSQLKNIRSILSTAISNRKRKLTDESYISEAPNMLIKKKLKNKAKALKFKQRKADRISNKTQTQNTIVVNKEHYEMLQKLLLEYEKNKQ